MTSPVIEAANLSKDHFSNMLLRRSRVLDDLTLVVAAHESYGLLGLNGAGKTTTLKLFLGLLKPTSGKAQVLGLPAGDCRALSRIGFLPENPYFYSYLTAIEFLDFVGQTFGLDARHRRDRARELLEMVSMRQAQNIPVWKYSKGMLQRLGIAQALINDPEVVFLDEPMSGLDPIGRRDVRLILHKLKEKGKTVFLNSHLLPDVHEVCDQVGVLHRGQLVGQSSIAAIVKGGSYRDLEDYFLETVSCAESKRQDKQKLAKAK